MKQANNSSADSWAYIEARHSEKVTLGCKMDSTANILLSSASSLENSANNESNIEDSKGCSSELLAYNSDCLDCSLESLPGTAVTVQNNSESLVSSSEKSENKQAMLDCKMGLWASKDSSANKMLNTQGLSLDTLGLLASSLDSMESKSSKANSWAMSDCNLATSVSSEDLSANKLCLWDCMMDSWANMRDLRTLLAYNLDSRASTKAMPMVSVGNKETFRPESLDSVTNWATSLMHQIERLARSSDPQESFHSQDLRSKIIN